MFKKVISALVLFTFISSMIFPGRIYAQGASELPAPGTMMGLSHTFEPVLIKGLRVHLDNPFLFDFILDPGNDIRAMSDRSYLQDQSTKLIKYFLASMTVPEKDLWVNLSPYENNRIIAANLGATEMGRDMLAQDYILKQLTASLIYPEKSLGRIFWDKVYSKAQQLYGTTQIPVNTFNKVWVVADKADVFENKDTAFVVGAHLKVMLEEDYLALSRHEGGPGMAEESQPNRAHSITSQIVREIILPAIEKEVNEGKNFVPLRQMFYSMVLASWYKMALKDALLTQIYGNQSKVKVGINLDDPTEKDKIFQRYLQAYKKGVFNYIKEDFSQDTQAPTPRKYFSGGLQVFPDGKPASIIKRYRNVPAGDELPRSAFMARVPLRIPGINKAMTSNPIEQAREMIPIMNDVQEKAIEEGKLEVGIAIQGLGLEGKPDAEREMSAVEAEYRTKPGAIFQKAKYLKAYAVPDGIHNYGNIPGVMPLADKILHELAPTPMSEEEIQAGKVRVHMMALESGGGTRAASLTINAGNKGEIMMYGRTFLEQAIQQVKALAYGLPAGEYFVVVPSDNIMLPTADMHRQYSKDRGFYLYAQGTPVLGQGLRVQLDRLAELGHMLLDKKGNVKADGFVEKPDLWELNYRTLNNSIQNAYEDENERDMALAEIERLIRGSDILNSYFSVTGQRDTAARLMPFVVNEEVWNFKGKTKKEKEKELYGHRPDEFKRFSEEEWRQIEAHAKALIKANRRLDRKLKEFLDKGGRDTYANTFYFMIRRDVMEFISSLYSQPTQRQNGSFWARNLAPGQSPINGFPDWSGLILTPMSYADNERGRKMWMDKYWDTARKALSAARTEMGKEGQAVDTDELSVWGERATTYTPNDWETLYLMAQRVKAKAGGMVGINFGPVWADAGSPAEAKRILDEGTAEGPMRDIYNALFGRPLSKSVSNVIIEGNVKYSETRKGEPTSVVIRNSVIKVPPGITLIIGKNVRIEDSYLNLSSYENQTKYIIFEDGVVIVGSHIEGRVGTLVRNVYINELHTDNGIGRTQPEEVVGTLFDTEGQAHMTWHPVDVDVKGERSRGEEAKFGKAPYSVNKLLSDLEGMEPKIIDRDKIREVRRALQTKIDAELRAAGKTGKPSQAMTVEPPVGGIDLNHANMQMNLEKQGAGVQMGFDPALIERIKREGFDGLEFKIESIVPITNLPMLTGRLSMQEEGQKLSKT